MKNNLTFYCLTEQPSLTSGDTISLGGERVSYTIRLQEDFHYVPDELYNNPLEIWELSFEK